MCAIVLSYQNEATVCDAVQSLLDQDEPLEVVVSHSGGGPTPELVAERFPDVPVLASEERRRPGGARNAGIDATSAPLVAFHAADSLALSGWAAGRLRRHRRGAAAVASAMHTPKEPTPLAAHLLLHSYRMPHIVPAPRLYFGLSYTRGLLDRFGPFREELDGEEDERLNRAMLRAGVDIEWAPEVMTSHAYPETAGAMLADQRRRGDLRCRMQAGLKPRAWLVARALFNAPEGLWRGLRPGAPVSRGAVARSVPLVLAGAVASAAGVATAERP